MAEVHFWMEGRHLEYEAEAAGSLAVSFIQLRLMQQMQKRPLVLLSTVQS